MTKYYIREIAGAQIILRMVLVTKEIAERMLEGFRLNHPKSIFDMKEYE